MPSQFTVTSEEAGQRLDVFCVSKLPQVSRAALQRVIKIGGVTVNGAPAKPRHVLQADDAVAIHIQAPPTTAMPLSPPSIPILYEDRDVVVIDKSPGIAVHAGHGIQGGTVADWFVQRYPESASVGDPGRPGPEVEIRSGSQRDLVSRQGRESNFHYRAGIVHRLDKDTSGVLILAKNALAHAALKEQFQRRRAHKEYLALVFGVPGEKKGRITRPLARSKRNPLRRTVDPQGKEAATEWWLEEKFSDSYALLRVKPFTGRMHQIRVHLHFLGFPIVGDTLYTYKRQRPPLGTVRQLLHAEKLKLMLPSGTRKTFIAPLPADFTAVLESLRLTK